jgi:phage anti-repressor protein
MDNSIKPYDSNSNFRQSNFEYKNIKYDISVSLYSNLIFIIISSEGKITNLYSMDTDAFTEENNYYDNEEDKSEIEIAKCILGDRRNEKNQFIANLLLTYISKSISSKSDKIEKIILSLNLNNPNENNENNLNFELSNETKELIDILKSNISKIFNI